MASILTPIIDPDKLMEERVYGDVSFANANPDTITRADGTAFDALTLTYGDGDYVTVRGSTQNDGTYQIASVTATVITLQNNESLTADANDSATLYFFKVDDTNGRFDTDAIHIDAVSKTFYFKGGGNLASGGSGVTGQALYSFFKDLWANVTEITKYDFPMLSITNEQFEFIDNWTPDDGYLISDTADDIDFTAPDLIDGAGAYDFTDYYKVGDFITVTTVSGTNDGTYEIATVGATQIEVVEQTISTEAAATAGDVDLQSNIVEQSGSFNTSTRKIIRTAGWSEVDAVGVAHERYSGIISLGTLGSTDQPYFAQTSSLTASTTNTEYTGPVNEAVKIFATTTIDVTDISFDDTADSILSVTTDLSIFNVGDIITVVTNSGTNDGNYTVTSVLGPHEIRVSEAVTTEDATTAGASTVSLSYVDYFTIYVRERGKLYADANLADIGVTAMTYIVYRFPVANAADLNLETTADVQIDATSDGTADVSPYDVVDIEYLPNPDTGTGRVNITGAYADATTYALGDVAQDVGDSQGNGASRWYYVDATTGDSNAGTMAADTNNTWVLWDKATGGGERFVNDGYYAFEVIIDANNTVNTVTSPYTNASGGDKENVYDFAQWALRQSGTIDTLSSQNGNIADLLVEFVGATLETADGVFIDDLSPIDTNNVVFNDYEGNPRTYPLVVTVTINFNNNLTADGDAVFFAYYTDPVVDISASGTGNETAGGDTITDATKNYPVNGLVGLNGAISGTTADDGTYVVASNTATAVTFTGLSYSNDESGTTNISVTFTGNEFGTTGANQVVDSQANPVGQDAPQGQNNVPDSGQYQFSYDYDGDTTAGRTVSTPVNITVVAIGLSTGQYVSASGNITSGGLTLSLVAPLERNYSNVS